MKGLSHDIQLALDTIIEGLDYRFKVEKVDSDELKLTMKSKLSSFNTAKELLDKWQNSPNAPSDITFKKYVTRIAESGDASLSILRRALKLGINYRRVKESRHYLAIESKTFILNLIIELEASVIELKSQIESGNVILKSKEFKRGFPEKYANGEFLHISKYYKDWYNEKEDAIVIDPKGSKGPIIELDGLKIQLPNPPKDRKKRLFFDKKKVDQYWRREPLPKGLSIGNATTYYDYIMEQFRRRREGVWFMNNGTPTYLTGRHWFQLQWGKMMDGGIYPNYRDCQRLLAYHKEACYIDNRCMGQIFLKSRQTGYTYGIVSDSIEVATSRLNIRNGLTSMTEDDAKKAFSKQSYLFQELPFFFQPVIKGRVDSLSKIDFGRPANLSKQSKIEKDTTTEGFLNSTLDYQATKVKAYDGQSLAFYIGDECYLPDTKILMADMSFKPVKDIKSGDLVMTEGGDPIEVSHLNEGMTMMYEVVQPHAKNYVVTENHRLLVDYGQDIARTKAQYISPKEYQKFNNFRKRMTRRKVFSGVEFEEREFLIPPYILGAWLGDGYSKSASFIVNPQKDYPIYEAISEFAKSNNFSVTKHKDSRDTYWKIHLVDNAKVRGENRFVRELKDLGIFKNKRIPKEYKICSMEQRTELLAGILDTDGYKSLSNRVEFKMSRKKLINDIYHTSKSCGLDTSEIRESKTNFDTIAYCLDITDYEAKIKSKIPRKQPIPTKKVNRKGRISDIKPIGIKEFCGVTLKTYDDNKRKLILEDYTLSMNSAKWGKISYIEHLNTLLPTIFRGGRITGKCFLGSTFGKLEEGGYDYRVLYLNSKVKNREVSGHTATKLYSYFMAAHKNFEQCIDKYGHCHETTPVTTTYNTFGDLIKIGSIESIQNLYKEAKKQGDAALNATYRQFPMTENHAMRDEAESCVFNLTKLMDQFDHNEALEMEGTKCVRGSFEWEDGIRFSKVIWYPDERGRFNVFWMPSAADGTKLLQNNVKKIYSKYHPMNDYACIGVDSYGSYVKGKNKQSNGAAHAASIENMVGVPPNQFLFEYIDKPATQDIFNEDILKAAWFYGIPILAENNRKDFVKYIYLQDCRPFSLNRIDVPQHKLTGDDLVLGGQPMTNKHILNTHENAIRTFVQRYIGKKDDERLRGETPMGDLGEMPFNRTIADWMKFDPSQRTGFDATISSGLALMGSQRHKYKPKPKVVDFKKTASILRKYSNSGEIGVFIK